MVPSQNSHQDSETLSKFLENSEFRKLYCHLLKLLKKYRNLEANSLFLQECLTKKLIPMSFRVKNSSKNAPKEYKNKCKELTIKTSFDIIGIALEKDIEKENKLLEEITSQFNIISLLSYSENYKQ